LEPHDLFVSKLVAWREKDQLFLKGMLRHKFAKPGTILERIEQLPVSTSHKRELAAALKRLVAEMQTKKPPTRKKK